MDGRSLTRRAAMPPGARFDVVMAWSVDRLGRSLQNLVGFLDELHALKIDLFLKTQGIDTTTPGGKALFQMMGVFAEFERSMIQERVRAGLQRARREGKRLGRPPIAPKLKERIQEALKAPGRPRGRARDRRAVRHQSWHCAGDQRGAGRAPFRAKRRGVRPRCARLKI
jgi:DNA invertase Pin-like site-specific DNA recombinase